MKADISTPSACVQPVQWTPVDTLKQPKMTSPLRDKALAFLAAQPAQPNGKPWSARTLAAAVDISKSLAAEVLKELAITSE